MAICLQGLCTSSASLTPPMLCFLLLFLISMMRTQLMGFGFPCPQLPSRLLLLLRLLPRPRSRQLLALRPATCGLLAATSKRSSRTSRAAALRPLPPPRLTSRRTKGLGVPPRPGRSPTGSVAEAASTAGLCAGSMLQLRFNEWAIWRFSVFNV